MAGQVKKGSDGSGLGISVSPTHYVGIGASAGGLEAIETFFKHMPDNSGVTFIIVQHLSPKHKSMMADLLSRHTNMPVEFAENNVRAKANCIYLIPPKMNLTIFHGCLLLTEQDQDHGLNLPIDLFLRSLADDQGEKAIGIILSGTGSDGTRGLRAIKEKLGLALVQDETSAKFDGMPQSAISTGLADFILPVEELPQQLINCISHPLPEKNALSELMINDDGALPRIFSLLREKEGVDFSNYKPSTILRRLERRLLVNNMQSLGEYLGFIENSPTEVNTLYHELLIGVTNFFRDKDAFNVLENKVLPELLGKSPRQEIRIWVAGCSTGEEAYSLAMLCRNTMEKMGKLFDVRVFATDVDRHAITFASNGVYPISIAADLPEEYLAKYFVRLEDGYQVSHTIRQMVIFAQHNLIKDPPFTKMDLVSCRNLLIYLQPVLQRKVLDMFNFALIPQGIMFLGASETTGENADYFQAVDSKWKIFKSKGKRKNEQLFSAQLQYDNAKAIPQFSRKFQLKSIEQEMIMDRLVQLVGRDYLPTTLIINNQNELIHTIGDAEGLFRAPSGRTTSDITRMIIKDLAVPMATGLHKVASNQEPVSYSNIHVSLNGKPVAFKLSIKALPWKQGQERLTAVFLERLNDHKKADGEIVQAYDVSREAQQRITDLEQSLQFHKENLQATVEELETSNEELQATNEELMASNEELQSTNEELQSVNEELYTLNSEYQAKIIELTELNNDIENLYRAADMTMMFLDENLCIRKFTSTSDDLVSLIDADVGRHFSNINIGMKGMNLHRLVEEVQRSGSALVTEIQSQKSDRWYLMKIKPYMVSRDVASGVFLSFSDISHRKLMENDLLATRARNNEALAFANMGSWSWDINSGALAWSDNIEGLFGLAVGEFEGTFDAFLSRVHPDDRKVLKAEIEACINGDKEYNATHRIVWPDGSIHLMREVGNVVRDPSGHPVSMYGLVRDVTAEVAEGNALREATDHLKAVLDSMGDAEVTIDDKGEILSFNLAASVIFGFAESEALGRNVSMLMAEPDRSRHDSYIKRYMQTGEAKVIGVARQVMAASKSGAVFPVQLAITEINAGEQRKFVGVLRKVNHQDTLR